MARPLNTAPEFCEERARQCLRLIVSCTDPAAMEALKKLAQEYELMAAELRAREEHRAAREEREYFRALRKARQKPR